MKAIPAPIQISALDFSGEKWEAAKTKTSSPRCAQAPASSLLPNSFSDSNRNDNACDMSPPKALHGRIEQLSLSDQLSNILLVVNLIAAAQMNSSADKAANLASASELVEQAARIGCALIAFPENFSWMGPESQREAAAETLQGPTLSEMAELAQRHHLMILAGSILEKGAPDNRLYNTSVLFDDQGVQRARYRKIHLFDAELPDGTSYRESSAIAPGEEVVTVTTPLGRLGLSICYDLRFPELYRQMADQQVSLILVPSAFTATTGRDHWEVLLRARAIENQSYVLAPAQVGFHGREGNLQRRTYGHAMMIDPWGVVVATVTEGSEAAPALAVGPIDALKMSQIRSQLPSLKHRRL